MAKNKSGQTAYGAAIGRLIEQYQPNSSRLFNDNLIKDFLPRAFTVFMKLPLVRKWMTGAFDKQTKGIFGGLICRTKYIDEKTLFATKDVQQILILGSGLDTRAYRFKELKSCKIFEVDLASVQDFKKEKIEKHFGSLPSNVSYVAIDFNSQTLDEVLKQNNFDYTKPTFIIWEGVTQYITKEAVERTFDFISRTAQGSSIVFTYILDSVVKKQSDIVGANELMQRFEKKNSSWQFGIEPTELKSLLEKYNLQILEDIGADYYEEKYLQPLNRRLDVTQIERAVFARIIKSL